MFINTIEYIQLMSLCFSYSAVRAVTWGEGSTVFATASDPFHTRELGAISIFDFPSQEVLSTREISLFFLIIMYYFTSVPDLNRLKSYLQLISQPRCRHQIVSITVPFMRP